MGVNPTWNMEFQKFHQVLIHAIAFPPFHQCHSIEWVIATLPIPPGNGRTGKAYQAIRNAHLLRRYFYPDRD